MHWENRAFFNVTASTRLLYYNNMCRFSLDNVWVLFGDFLKGGRFSITASKVIYYLLIWYCHLYWLSQSLSMLHFSWRFPFERIIYLNKFFNWSLKNFSKTSKYRWYLFNSSVFYDPKFRFSPRNKMVWLIFRRIHGGRNGEYEQ